MRTAPFLISALLAGSMIIPAPYALAAVTTAAATDNNVAALPVLVLPQSVLDIPMTDIDGTGDAIEDTGLTDLRGGESIVVGNQTLSAISNGNSIGGSYTAGNVNLSDNALSNFAGIGNVVINTGAQANLQAGMNLIINLVP
jgi:hypothetical protein